jgi:hypothetical protein
LIYLKNMSFFITVLLLFLAANAKAQVLIAVGEPEPILEKCYVLEDAESIKVTNKEFDLIHSLRGEKLELCQFERHVRLYKVSSIKYSDSVGYVTLQLICTGLKESENLDRSSRIDLSEIVVNCKYGDRHTRMCLTEISDCKSYAREKFISTSHVRTDELASILDFIKDFRLKRNIDFDQDALHKEMSLATLRWILESKYEPKIETIIFEDYSTQDVHSGRFQVRARQGYKIWSAVVAKNGVGFSLIHVGVLNQ